MADLAKVGDPVTCPRCGPNHIVSGSPDTLVDDQPAALVGVSKTACGATIISGLSWFFIDNCHAAVHGSMHSHGGVVLSSSTVKTGAPSSVAGRYATASPVDFNHVSYADERYEYGADPNQPHLKGGLVFIGEPEQACVFAKTCSVPPESTEAGTGIEPVANFGQAMVMGSTAIVSTEGGATLGRVAGQAALETLGTWSLRGAAAAAGTAASTLLLALWPTSMGDATLTEEQLRGMMVAPTRVRFQFRRDAEGIMRVYGIHTSAASGMDSVPVVSQWRQIGSAMEAQLNGVTIIWTPNEGPVVQAPTTYPGVTDALENILVHPVAEGTDSQLEIYPTSDDMTWQDCILVLPIESGVPPLYVVFAKPAVNPLETGLYGSFSGRPRNGLHLDHMPSQGAIRRHLEGIAPDLEVEEIEQLLKSVASIAVPARVHQKYSETYGWRNTKVRQAIDSDDLRAAVDSNFNTIKPYLLEEGYSEGDIEVAREQMHQINEEQGWY
ncbi:S-type pyocin domain-containing protein [Pseudomonas aeruginosa]|uniref:S-type pyocin domain-containing protein n=3 Tax=Pseudomonas aeruginosa TaxID=287 RepID=UPI0009A84181|nr:S-type pyocin domain-containing protein [Pseudomonas aeruginosa]MBG4396353.1 S-type pyocin domain-containing protein [Pseudomonas aeruginosa]MBU5959260.1 S-type pyocin domain-containing protein [Pseudomonas aeruginosa]MCT4935190.1 S-type pyocin domain-containing protein [Pseudomonas aeruginosa]MEB6161676.1 S-type pyocin domain-containing protein [Pseudomonas aeruginosa]NNB81501.1 pyocin [Pseudomonas aeruginosa]